MNEAEQFLKADLSIRAVRNVWSCRTDRWKRDFFAPRGLDALVFFHSGTIDYCFSDRVERATAGQLIVLDGKTPYSGKKIGNEDNAFTVVDFESDPATPLLSFPIPTVLTPKDGSDVERRFAKLLDDFRSGGAGRLLRCRADLYDLLHLLFCEALPERRTKRDARLLLYLEYIEKNLADPSLTVKSLAERFHMSEVHFRRLFTAAMGVSPHAYLSERRMETARDALLYMPHLSVAQVAERCGYAGIYHFSSDFSKRNGMSPSAFRKQNGQNVGGF